MTLCHWCHREIEAFDPFTLDGFYFCSNWCLIAYRRKRTEPTRPSYGCAAEARRLAEFSRVREGGVGS